MTLCLYDVVVSKDLVGSYRRWEGMSSLLLLLLLLLLCPAALGEK